MHLRFNDTTKTSVLCFQNKSYSVNRDLKITSTVLKIKVIAIFTKKIIYSTLISTYSMIILSYCQSGSTASHFLSLVTMALPLAITAVLVLRHYIITSLVIRLVLVLVTLLVTSHWTEVRTRHSHDP